MTAVDSAITTHKNLGVLHKAEHISSATISGCLKRAFGQGFHSKQGLLQDLKSKQMME